MQYRTQTRRIENAILNAINDGMTNKREIFTAVVKALDVPRPTVRRTSKGLLKNLRYKVEILSCYGKTAKMKFNYLNMPQLAP